METGQVRAESVAERSHKHPQTGKSVRKTLAVHREKVEEGAHPPTGKWYNKDSTGQVPLFFPDEGQKEAT